MNKNQIAGTSAKNKNAGTISENKTSVEKAERDEPPGGMVRVFGGEFMMGSDGGDEYERPAHRVAVKPFYIDKTEVTCEDYKNLSMRPDTPRLRAGRTIISPSARR